MPDEKEFIALLQQHQNIIHKVCRVYLQDAYDRRDLFQDVVLAAWKGFANFRGDAKFSTWLYRVALNTAISFRRRTQSRPHTSPLDYAMAGLPAEEPDNAADQRKALYACINELSAIDKALVMLYMDDYSHAEIAEYMGITANHVGVKLNRIKTKLKEATQKYLSN